MPDNSFNSSILASTQDSLDFITNVLQASTEAAFFQKPIDNQELMTAIHRALFK